MPPPPIPKPRSAKPSPYIAPQNNSANPLQAVRGQVPSPATPESSEDEGYEEKGQARPLDDSGEEREDAEGKIERGENEDEASKPAATVVIASTPSTLADITAALDTLKIDKVPTRPTSPPRRRNISTVPTGAPSTRQTRGGHSRKSQSPDTRLSWLAPLLDSYESNGNPRPQIKDWDSVPDRFETL